MKQIIAFTGLPGTGKSTLAEALATETGVPAFAGDWYPRLTGEHLVVDALDPVDANLDRVRTYLRRW